MTNAEVISDLKKILSETQTRLDELEALKPGLSPDDLQQVNKRRAKIFTKRLTAELRLSRRERAEALETEVAPLSTERRKAMKDALGDVSKSISSTRTLKANLELADNVADATNSANAASTLT